MYLFLICIQNTKVEHRVRSPLLIFTFFSQYDCISRLRAARWADIIYVYFSLNSEGANTNNKICRFETDQIIAH